MSSLSFVSRASLVVTGAAMVQVAGHEQERGLTASHGAEYGRST
jgi:hypothetical protein